VARNLVEAARGGDVAAAKLLLAYTLGRPTPAVDPDGLDRAEWLLCQEWPDSVLSFAGLPKISFADAVRKLQNAAAGRRE
jgi:hypothetical protein